MKSVLAILLTVLFLIFCAAGCANGAADNGTDTGSATAAPDTEPETTEPETTEPETTEPETEPVTFGEFVVTPDEEATLAMPLMFGDYMVLQRDAAITVWGTSNREGAEIRGLFMDDEARGKVADGKWEMTFSPKPVTTEPQTMTIDDSCGNTITFSEILIGDVWVIGGQSNAEASSIHIPQAYKDISPDPDRLLRIFQQGADDVIPNKDKAKEPLDDLLNRKRKWVPATKENVRDVTLLGLFLGERLADETGIPIGILSIAANGAKLCEFMPAELAKQFKYKLGGNVNVSGFYNALIHPFLRLKFKAMVFFQGESEAFTGANPSPKNYDRDIKAFFTEMRTRWGFDFPIYNIQLSDYTSKSVNSSMNTGYVRAQQFNAYLDMTGVRIIPSYDLGADEGDMNYMHSPKKKALANRVADLALADQYGIGSADDALAPEPVEITVSEDKTYATVKFKNVGDGLVSTSGDNKVSGFAVGKLVKLTKAEAEIISEDTVKVYLPGSSAVGLAYACFAHVTAEDVQLYNSNGLPAVAFFKTFN